ncbi:hypothetical protein ACFPRL_28335 [Pseudoclavibacter helvolus]
MGVSWRPSSGVVVTSLSAMASPAFPESCLCAALRWACAQRALGARRGPLAAPGSAIRRGP